MALYLYLVPNNVCFMISHAPFVVVVCLCTLGCGILVKMPGVKKRIGVVGGEGPSANAGRNVGHSGGIINRVTNHAESERISPWSWTDRLICKYYATQRFTIYKQ